MKKKNELTLFHPESHTLSVYLQEIQKIPLLTQEEEEYHLKKMIEESSIDSAKILVSANLRLVVKIAMEYKHAYNNPLDLIQEGNIGLMKAVSKYDPSKGAKLSYYASWWIKSYILKFLLDNFKLVKVTSTHDQKKLFYNLMKEKSRLEAQGIKPETRLIASNLGVSEKSVVEMEQRLSDQSKDLSLDLISEDQPLLEKLKLQEENSPEDLLENHESLEKLKIHLEQFLSKLNERDREVFSRRLLQELPDSLQEIATDLGVSKERVRQIIENLLKKLKLYMKDYLG